MVSIDLNCDMGEGAGNDALIMPYISSSSIACGYHAGDPRSMWDTVTLARRYGKAIGAHVSFLDREGFGRKEMHISAGEVYELVEQQLILFREIADAMEMPVQHVKPHGALYNQAARESDLAGAVAKAIHDFDPHLLVYGLSSSALIQEAERLGLRAVSEAFADRTYQDDGSLTPRSQPGALIDDPEKALMQVIQIMGNREVTAVSGKQVPVIAQTICMHGDGRNADEFAAFLYQGLDEAGFAIRAPGRKQ